jgi:hypothetical protein
MRSWLSFVDGFAITFTSEVGRKKPRLVANYGARSVQKHFDINQPLPIERRAYGLRS